MWEPRQNRQGALSTTMQIMLDLIFMGHADQALMLLLNSTNSHLDVTLCWSELCAILVADSNWKMHGMLPGAAQIEKQAAGA